MAEDDLLEDRIAAVAAKHPGKPVDCYVLFFGHTDAMKLYTLARERGMAARVSPTPRAARSSCGVALLVPVDEAVRVRDLARSSDVPIEGIVPLVRQINPRRDKYC